MRALERARQRGGGSWGVRGVPWGSPSGRRPRNRRGEAREATSSGAKGCPDRWWARGLGSGSGPAASPQPINSTQPAASAACPPRASHPALCLHQTQGLCRRAGSRDPKGGQWRGGEVTTFPLDSWTWRMTDDGQGLSVGCPVLDLGSRGAQTSWEGGGQRLGLGSLLPRAFVGLHSLL